MIHFGYVNQEMFITECDEIFEIGFWGDMDDAGKDAHPGQAWRLSCTKISQSEQKYFEHDLQEYI